MTMTAEQPRLGTAPASLAPTSLAPTSLAPTSLAPTSLVIDNLRAVVILAVLAFHSVLAYLNFLPPHPYAFEVPPFLWRAFPIVDGQRWFGFDLFCAWLDVFLMSFFFLLSGLFTWPSLARRGARRFLYDRVLRLGLPFAAVVLFLVPLAHYPTYLQSATDPSFAGFWSHWLALPFWPSGPMWFLWLLLVGDAAAAGLFQLMAGRRDAVSRISAYARAHPARFLAGFVAAGAVAYIPLAVVFGSSAWFQLGPFAFQLSRPLHYALYFFAGVVIGACGIERSLVAPDGPLARRWARWLIAALLLFLLWICLTAVVVADPGAGSPSFLALDALSFALACFSSCFFVLASAMRFARVRSPVLDSLKANAYGMYLVHYGFVVWLQYALLTAELPAVVKAATVFGGAVLLSWSASASLRRLPAVARIIGAERRRAAGAVRPAAAPSQAAGLAD
jgi:glucans biosynthesis protein C